MHTEFDPYRMWLGIPSDVQPKDYYTLLGLPRFSTDITAIATNAVSRTEYLQSAWTPENGIWVNRLMGEIAVVHNCSNSTLLPL